MLDVIVSEAEFNRTLCRERKRAERSHRDLLLMLVKCKIADTALMDKVAVHVSAAVRDTDITGWFSSDIVGAIFTEIGKAAPAVAIKTLELKISQSFHKNLNKEQIESLQIVFYAFPDLWVGDWQSAPLYPDLLKQEKEKKVHLAIKRVMDIVGSGAALISLSPVFLALAVAVKLTSKGPIFFRQPRVSQYGKHFTFLKFRSMRVANTDAVHQTFVKDFITGKAEEGVFKIKNPRITALGAIMRRTSLDEIPQFWNVFVGEMSLVGPRPPIPYELEAYDVWHRRRLLEVKPGITGLWQIKGRSSTTFDEMVRLDLEYSRTWSPLLDMKILLNTPRAVIFGDGAY